ncbi:unnamed protein product [Pleuronectes platessa]|uniref:Uncharacterized protein n=1 Tax=Pleuronectes platessa TaxID=8262 RepID=A0A9N7VCM8_PLEPL|nr:unnamed protein product [Pleuronectes platessa]
MTDESICDEVEKKQQTKNPIKNSATLGIPLALCSTRNLKEYDCTPLSGPPTAQRGPHNPPQLFTLLRWPLTQGDVSVRNRCEGLSVDGGSEADWIKGSQLFGLLGWRNWHLSAVMQGQECQCDRAALAALPLTASRR